MERHRHDYVKPLLPRKRAAEHRAQFRRERLHATVLKDMNEFAQSALILSECEGCIESGQPASAKSTTAICVERSRIQKRRLAIDAKVFCYERFRFAKTIRANWNSGNISKTLAAYAALFREDEVEQRCRDGPDCAGVEYRSN
jgi:hypothetical protein